MGIKQFLSLPTVQTLLPVTFGYSLISEAVVMRELKRWKRLWRRSLIRSYKRTSMGLSRSCWNGTTSALQSEEITSKGLEFHVCTINRNAHTKKVWKLILWSSYVVQFALEKVKVLNRYSHLRKLSFKIKIFSEKQYHSSASHVYPKLYLHKNNLHNNLQNNKYNICIDQC